MCKINIFFWLVALPNYVLLPKSSTLCLWVFWLNFVKNLIIYSICYLNISVRFQADFIATHTYVSGLPGSKKLKRPNLAISCFKKVKFSSNLNLLFHKMLKICSDLFKTCLEMCYFAKIKKRQKKWPNGQTILFLANSFKKAKFGRFGL